VDDEITSRFILKAILDQYFTCDMAENGEEALCAFDQAHLQDTHYNVICLDITMPGMDGLKVLKSIKDAELALSLGPQLEAKVIIVTADNASATILNSFFECGASAYITKPIDRHKLIHELNNLALI
jgi:two-component system chemotaxis response regulator CheY